MVEVVTYFSSDLWSTHTNKVERKFLQDNDKTKHDLWGIILANLKTIHAKNEWNKDKNIEMDVWKKQGKII